MESLNLDEFWDNLIFTNDEPFNPDAKDWSLRGHKKVDKNKPKEEKNAARGWFQMTILSSNCATKNEAIEKAKEFTMSTVVHEKLQS